jgi:7-cyano-7-deazaguanine synthase
MTRQTTNQPNSDARGRAVILLSGGLDSYTTAAIAQQDGFICYGLTVNYGQRHSREIEAAKNVAQSLGLADHKIINLYLRDFGGSALTDNIDVPKTDETIGNDIPVTYVPARNTVLLSLALAWAEVLNAYNIFIGANAVDYSGYPDCRAEFIAAFEGLANIATKAAVTGKGRFQIHAPLLLMNKCDIILQGNDLGLDYSLTHSCYDPDIQGRACGKCDSCRLRLKGFEQAHLVDPVEYAGKD